MKRLGLLFFLMCCTACSQTQRLTSFFETPVSFDSPETLSQDAPSVKTVSMLLPLTGNQEVIGKDMQNAALMALKDQPQPRLRLLFFDTKGTPEGAKEAYQWAKAQNSDLILGPVFSNELKALGTSFLNAPNILSYTSDSTVLDQQKSSFALLIPNQIDTIIHQACLEGKQRIAVLGSESKTGEIVMNSLDKAIQKCPQMHLKKYGLYGEKEENLTPAILKILPPIVDPKKKNLTEEEQQILATPMQERLDFDLLIVFEDGIRLSQAIAILAFYDVNPQIVPIYTLASVKPLKDRALNGVLFADLPDKKNAVFTRRYWDIFGKKPASLASFAYDSVRWASDQADQEKLNLATLKNNGPYDGVDGLIRLNEDGTNTRGLRLVQKKGRLVQEIIPAPETLEQDPTAFFMLPTTESTDLTLVSPESWAESHGAPAQSNDFETPEQSPWD